MEDIASKVKSIIVYKLGAEESEVTEIQVHKITSDKDIENLPVAFPSGVSALEAWLKKIK